MTYNMTLDDFIKYWEKDGTRDRYYQKWYERMCEALPKNAEPTAGMKAYMEHGMRMPTPSCDTADHARIYCLKRSIWQPDGKEWIVTVFNMNPSETNVQNPQMLSIREAVEYCRYIKAHDKKEDD